MLIFDHLSVSLAPMQINFKDLSPNQRYGTMVQTLVPRPIAWVLSDNGDDSYNVAPFSFFTGISSEPPLLMLSIGKKDATVEKDTRLNIRERDYFVVHIPSARHVEQVNQTSQTLAHGESEADLAKLDLIELDGFPLPRIADCDVAFACKRHRIDEMGDMEQVVIYGEILSVTMNDDIIKSAENNRVHVDPLKLDPLARLGGSNYSSVGEILSAKRPK